MTPCMFTATDGRACVLPAWHRCPRKRKGHFVTYGDVGDGHLVAGEQPCRWGNGTRPITRTANERTTR